MKPSEAFKKYRHNIRTIALAHHAKNIRYFGSVLHQEDTEGSDLDLLIEPTDETTLMDIAAIRYEIRELLGVSIDVLTPNALPESFRQQILDEAQQV